MVKRTLGADIQKATDKLGITKPKRVVRTKWGGSGWGKHKKSQRKVNFNKLRKGDLLLNQDAQFKAKNIIKVTKVNRNFRRTVEWYFVDPKNTRKRRLPDDQTHAFHEFELDRSKGYESQYYHPVRRK